MVTIWLFLLAVCARQAVSQPTFIDDVTLCNDVRDYRRIIRTLDAVAQEVKLLRMSIRSVQKSQVNVAKSLEENVKTSGLIYDAIKSHGLVQSTENMNKINGAVTQLSKRLGGLERLIESKTNLLQSTIEHHNDKAVLSSQILKFQVSQKFSKMEDSAKSSFQQLGQQLYSVNQDIVEKMETFKQNVTSVLLTTAKNTTEIITNGFRSQLTQGRAAIATTLALANQTLSSNINTGTITTLDAIKNLKDILNHHHVTTRLAGGTSPLNGRVEVFLNGIWGTVCDDEWDDKDASVVCKKLGFCNGTALSRGFYGPGNGPVILDNLTCKGNETDLFECPHNGIGIENCDRFEDAAVQCSRC